MEHRDPGNETDLDALAKTQAAQEAEREVIDAAAALEAAQGALNQADQKAKDLGQNVDPHEAQRKALGFDLAWWDEENETPPLDIVVDLTGQACGRLHYTKALEDAGLDLTPTLGYIGLNAKTGPLVAAALQILGTLHAHIREDIVPLLQQCSDAVPEFTEEFKAEHERIVAEYEEQQMRAFAASMGLELPDEDEIAEEIVRRDEQRQDASNN